MNQTEKRLLWIDDNLVAPRLLADPDSPARIARYLRGMAAEHVRTVKVAALPFLVKISLLPREVLNEILSDQMFARVLSEDPNDVRFGTSAFEPRVFFSAARTALIEGVARCQSRVNIDFELRAVSAVQSRLPGVIVEHPEFGPLFLDVNSLYSYLAVEKVTKSQIGDLIESVELDPVERENTLNQALESEPLERFMILRDVLMHGAQFVYAQLAGNIRASQHADADKLIVSPKVLLRFLGFTDGACPVNSAAANLRKCTSLAVAIERWLAVPMELPQCLADEFKALPRHAQRAIVKRLLRRVISPVALVNLLPLVQQSVYERAAMRATSRLVEQACLAYDSGAFKPVISLARFSANGLSRSPDVETWSDETYLATAWSNANELLRVFSAFPINREWLDNVTAGPEVHFEEQLFAHQRRLDATHPSKVEAETLLLALVYSAIRHGIKVSTPTKEKIVSRLLKITDDALSFKNSLFFESHRLRNVLKSSLGVMRNEQLLEVVGESLANSYAAAADQGNLSKELESAVPEGSLFPPGAGLLQYLGLIIGEASTPEQELRDIFDRWARQFDMPSLIRNGFESWYALYHFLVGNVVSAGNDEVTAHLASAMEDCLRAIGTLATEQRAMDTELALRIAILLAPSGTREEKLMFVASKLNRALDHVKDAAPVVRQIAMLYLRRAASQYSQHFAEIVVRARLLEA